MLKINEIFRSIQGEGGWAGASAIFVRFAGCNKNCSFCDTEHEKVNFNLSVEELIDAIKIYGGTNNIVVFTGGEPLIQPHNLLRSVIKGLKQEGYNHIHLETNGSIDGSVLDEFTYVSCSPKTNKLSINLLKVDCWKYLYPSPVTPLENIEPMPNRFYYVQPVDGIENSLSQSIEKVKELGIRWKLGVQLHKLIKEK